MGLDDPAEFVAIEPDDGTGRNVVTGTMTHPGPNILYLDITGLDEPLGVTDTHPIWSESRQDFVVAGQLQVGEQFRTLTGETATLTKITPHRGPPKTVFNLEVDAQHVYAVANNGLLVHNACKGESVDELPSLDRTGKVHGDLPHPEDLAKYDPDDLAILEDELLRSVQERIRKTSELGPKGNHGLRQAQEQDLFHSIRKFLEGRGL